MIAMKKPDSFRVKLHPIIFGLLLLLAVAGVHSVIDHFQNKALSESVLPSEEWEKAVRDQEEKAVAARSARERRVSDLIAKLARYGYRLGFLDGMIEKCD